MLDDKLIERSTYFTFDKFEEEEEERRRFDKFALHTGYPINIEQDFENSESIYLTKPTIRYCLPSIYI